MKSMVLILLVVSLAVVPVVNADGALDPSFGHGGLVVTQFGTFQPTIPMSVAVQPDGRAVASGWTNVNLEQTFMAAMRYLPSGELDPGFSGDGLAVVPFSGMPPGFIDVFASAEDVLVQPDGRILLIGGLQVWAGNFFALARLNPDGSPDAGFGNGGQVITKFPGGGGPYQAGAWGVGGLLQPDGRIVAVGIASPYSSLPGIAAARYNPDGKLDQTFGSIGQVVLPLSQPFTARDAALQPDGKVLIGGTYGSGDFGVVRLLPNGAPDTSFGNHGLATASFGGTERGDSVALLPDGRIVVAGDRYTTSQWVTDLAMVRFLADGTLDTSFGTGGLATTNAGPWEIPGQLLLLPNGKLLVAGTSTGFLTDGEDFLLERFDADGALDTTFGTAGLLRTDFHAFVDECHAVAIAGPELVLAAGGTGWVYQARDVALARYMLTTQDAAGSPETE